MRDSDEAQLGREAASFTRYLVGRPATPSLRRRYAVALDTLELDSGFDDSAAASQFDTRMLRVAAKHPVVTAMLDTASALLARESLLRRRLFVLAGLLETEPSYADRFVGQPPGRLGVVAGLAASGLRSAAHLVLGVPLLLAIRCAP